MLAENGYIMEGTEGLNHTESQAEWLKGNAAFIPCGIWLENEMKDMIPDGFDMVIDQAPGDKDACRAEGGEPFVVPSKAKNTVAGMEYLRCIISKESSKWFAVNVSAMMPVIGGTEGVTVSTGMQSAVAMVEKPAATTSSPACATAAGTATWARKRTPRWAICSPSASRRMQFVEAVQAMADKVKADPEVTKFTRE